MTTQDSCDYYIGLGKRLKLAKSNGNRLRTAMQYTEHNLIPRAIGRSTKWLQDQVVLALQIEGLEPSCRGYHGFPEDICISLNEEVAHGIPSKDRIITSEDVIKVDVVANRKGIHVDTCRTFSPGQGNHHNALHDVAKEAVLEAGKLLLPGVKMSLINDVLKAVICNRHDMHYIMDLYGHGIGTEIHMPPYIGPGIGDKEETAHFGDHIIQFGDMYALEVFVTETQGSSVQVGFDGWTLSPTIEGTLSAHYEDTFFIGQESINLTA